MTRGTRFTYGALLAGIPLLLSGAGVPAAPILCSAARPIMCEDGHDCRATSLDSLDLPPFIIIDLDRRTITNPEPDMADRSSEIRTFERGDGRMILQGIERGRGWSIVISEETAKMTAAVVGDGATVTVYGDCIPYAPSTDSGRPN